MQDLVLAKQIEYTAPDLDINQWHIKCIKVICYQQKKLVHLKITNGQ